MSGGRSPRHSGVAAGFAEGFIDAKRPRRGSRAEAANVQGLEHLNPFDVLQQMWADAQPGAGDSASEELVPTSRVQETGESSAWGQHA